VPVTNTPGQWPPGTVIAGRYEIVRELAAGGMSQVYLATQQPLGRKVALKCLVPLERDPEFHKRFLREASVSAQLAHPAIVTIHDYGQAEDGALYMAMEYLDGASLAELVALDGALAPKRVLRLAGGIARALRAAHRAGVVHRDLKPANIMLVHDEEVEGKERVKVLDFGLVKVFDTVLDRSDGAQLTAEGVVLGSPRYMAPEQIIGEDITPRTDVYALGAVIYHLLAGTPPFTASTSTMIFKMQLESAPPPLGVELPDGLGPFLAKCLEKSAADRFASMDEVIGELDAILLRAQTTPPLRISVPPPMPVVPLVRPPSLELDDTQVSPPPAESDGWKDVLGSSIPAPAMPPVVVAPPPEPPAPRAAPPTLIAPPDKRASVPPRPRPSASQASPPRPKKGGLGVPMVVLGVILAAALGLLFTGGGPRRTTLRVRSTPDRAAVSVDGEPRGLTPFELTMETPPRGQPIKVRLDLEGYVAQDLQIAPVQPVTEVDVTLVSSGSPPPSSEAPAASRSMLTVLSDPPGGDVEVNGVHIGKTPFVGSVPAGAKVVHVRVSIDGRIPWESEVPATASGHFNASAKLVLPPQ